VMVAGLMGSTLLCAASAAAPDFNSLLLARGAMGFTLAGLPAIAITYVTEEIPGPRATSAIGLFIGGSALGGMSGRLLAALTCHDLAFGPALLSNAAVGLVCGLVLALFLPPGSAALPPQAPNALRTLRRKLRRHLRDPRQVILDSVAFLLMGSFVTIYNFIGFRLQAPPFSLSTTASGAVFSLYITGVISSTLIGKLATRIGPRACLIGGLICMVVGGALTASPNLFGIALGLALFTIGFFGAHAIASSQVAATARQNRAQASALYAFFYYAGSSVMGPIGGMVWHDHGWMALTLFICTLPACALAMVGFLPDQRSHLA